MAKDISCFNTQFPLLPYSWESISLQGIFCLGIVIGFGLHFASLTYSENISERLLRMIS